MPETDDHTKKWSDSPIRSRKKPGEFPVAEKNATESRKNVPGRIFHAVWDRDLVRYLTVSAGTAIVYFSTIYGLHDLAGLRPTIAFSCAYIIGLAAHFLGNKLTTFQSRALAPTPREALKYCLLVLVNYGITLGCVHLAMLLLNSFYWGTVIAPPLTFLLSYPFMKYLVFKSQ